MKLIVFSHGKESGPSGKKITVLRNVAEANGYQTASLNYRDCNNASERIEQLRDYIHSQNTETIILVGSSMGGYVSTVIANDTQLNGLFLLCPALYMPMGEYTIQSYHPKCKKIEIVHGWQDDIVPVEISIRFGKQTKAVVNLVDDNHRLSESIGFLEKRFNSFLGTIE